MSPNPGGQSLDDDLRVGRGDRRGQVVEGGTDRASGVHDLQRSVDLEAGAGQQAAQHAAGPGGRLDHGLEQLGGPGIPRDVGPQQGPVHLDDGQRLLQIVARGAGEQAQGVVGAAQPLGLGLEATVEAIPRGGGDEQLVLPLLALGQGPDQLLVLAVQLEVGGHGGGQTRQLRAEGPEAVPGHRVGQVQVQASDLGLHPIHQGGGLAPRSGGEARSVDVDGQRPGLDPEAHPSAPRGDDGPADPGDRHRELDPIDLPEAQQLAELPTPSADQQHVGDLADPHPEERIPHGAAHMPRQIVVPDPGAEVISNSSTRRRAAPSPRPRPRTVETPRPTA